MGEFRCENLVEKLHFVQWGSFSSHPVGMDSSEIFILFKRFVLMFIHLKICNFFKCLMCVCVCDAATTLVLISVTAVNRIGPYFVPSVPVGVVAEREAPYSRVILNLTAATRDANPLYDAGPFRYRQMTYVDLFDVDSLTGAVQARVALDRRRAERYNVTVDVDNSASPPHTSSLVFRVSGQLCSYTSHSGQTSFFL